MDEKKRRKSKKKPRSNQDAIVASSVNGAHRSQEDGVQSQPLDNGGQEAGAMQQDDDDESVEKSFNRSLCASCVQHLDEIARLRSELDAKEQALDGVGDAIAQQLNNTAALRLNSLADCQEITQDNIGKLTAYVALMKDLWSNQKIVEDDLRLEIQQLKGDILQLRSVHEQRDAQIQEEMHVREENVQLRGKATQLHEKVKEMKGTNENLMDEHRQLKSKIAAMQTAMLQLEREAIIRAQVEDELREISTASELSKDGKDLVGAAATVVEDSRIQAAAAAAMVDKLVTENMALVEKVNEQSTLIDCLSQKYSYAMELQENGYLKIEQGNLECKTSENHFIVQQDLEPMAGSPAGEPGGQFQNSGRTREIEFSEVVSASVGVGLANDGIVMENACDGETQDVNSALQDYVKLTPQNQEDVVIAPIPFSDAPIMGAPIRLFSFLASYVSGADLVK